MAIHEYWYSGQLRNYLLQFCSIFTGLNVRTGKGENGTEMMYMVPVVIGSKDRVVAAIMAGNTQNKPFSIPMMAVQLQGLDLAPELRKGIGYVDRRVYLPSGGVFPDDLSVVTRVMPIPYMANLELAIYASNTEQLHQILEQILLIFDPVLQIQLSDATFDWTKITTVELTGISNEENYPVGQDRRVINWTLNFSMPIYLSAPMNLKDNVIREINIRLGNMDGMSVNEVDENGELQPFTEVFGPIIHIDKNTPH